MLYCSEPPYVRNRGFNSVVASPLSASIEVIDDLLGIA